MGAIFQLAYIVPKISKIEKVKAVQAAVHAYLLDKKIIKPEIELDYYGMDYYPLDVGFLAILNSRYLSDDAQKQSYFEQVLGVSYVTKRRHAFLGPITLAVTCPSCHATVGADDNDIDWMEDDAEEALYELEEDAGALIDPMIQAWKKGQDEVACPACEKKHEINQYTFQESAAFSNFGVAFLGAVSGELSDAFLQDLQAIIGHELIELDYSE